MGNHDNINTISFDEISRAIANENSTDNTDENKQKEQQTDAKLRTYRLIAGALASRYEAIYYINIVDNSYTQYSSSDDYARLGTSVQGKDFFVTAAEDIRKYIHPDDTRRVLQAIEKDSLLENLKEYGSLTLTYRQLLADRSQYVSMIIVRPKNDENHIVIAVLNKDDQIRRERSILEESETFSEISTALSARYEVIYLVNIRNNEYTEYSSSEKYSKLKAGAKGMDFFEDTQKNMQRDIYSEDLSMMSEFMDKAILLDHLCKTRKTFINYRLIFGGKEKEVKA